MHSAYRPPFAGQNLHSRYRPHALAPDAMTTPALLTWNEDAQPRQALWRDERGAAPPARVEVVDDRLRADAAFQLACGGTALLWRGDYHNARQLLTALARRLTTREKRRAVRPRKPADGPAAAFHRHRLAQAQRAQILSQLLVPFEAGYRLTLPRAPDVAAACEAAWGPLDQPAVMPLRAVLGAIGAWQWQLNGVEVPALGARIHPRYGVFSPVRGEYVDLVAQAPLPAAALERAFDLGTGSGVLAAVLAQRGVREVIATELDPRALACARDNLARLGYTQVRVEATDLFPTGSAPLIVCNPPWLPAKPTTPIEAALYDPDSRMLRAFLHGLNDHLTPDGEAWLILSDLAEHLGLRSPTLLAELFAAHGLAVAGRLDARPRHRKANDPDDPLHAARQRETTTLWRLRRAAALTPTDG